ncbi:MAG: thioesterase family protein [Mycolicibacterium cosmeticum]|nr:thioesterase family protein [Mycolicibacterium cosmeticum]
MHYFQRLDDTTFQATDHTGGAWNTSEQHIAPSLGLLAHAVECDRDARRTDGLRVARISYDILGTVPVGVVDVAVRVLRPGRSIELVEATLRHAERPVLVLRAWLMQSFETASLAATSFASMPPADDMPAWDPSSIWPGGFIASAQVRRIEQHPGRAAAWVRTDVRLLKGEAVSSTARAIGLLDISNGLAVRMNPADVAFPNIDLTAHLFAEPAGEWLGFDTTVSVSATGTGLTHSVIHDETGPIGVSSQMLTVRPSR